MSALRELMRPRISFVSFLRVFVLFAALYLLGVFLFPSWGLTCFWAVTVMAIVIWTFRFSKHRLRQVK